MVLFLICIDRSEGGASIRDGSIEVMVHRRILNDDSLGVGEALNESAFGQGLVVRGKHLLLVEPPASSALFHRVIAQQLYMHPLVTFGLTQSTYADYSAAYRQTWSALTDTLPLNLHLLTLDQLTAKDYLVRVENYFELNEDSTYSQPITFDLQSLFTTIGNITSVAELTLGGNLLLTNLQRLTWMTNDDESSQINVASKFFKQKKLFLNEVFYSF
jgi:lysosomal alpha-mannosidase